MNLSAGRIYRIKNKASGKYLAPFPEHKNNLGARIEQYDLLPGNHPDRDSQLWYVFPADGNKYLIVNKHSGLCLNIEGYSMGESFKCDQWRLQADATNRESQLWKLHDEGSGYCRISNARSSLYLYIESFTSDARFACQQGAKFTDASRSEFQHWQLEVERELPEITGLSKVESKPRDAIRLTGFNRPADASEPILMSHVAVPFPFVNGFQDADLAALRETSEHSPYYIMKRYDLWKLVYYYEYSGSYEHEEKQTTEIGVTTSSSTTVEKTTQITVTASTEFEYAGAANSMSTTINRELKVTTSDGIVIDKRVTKEITKKYERGQRLSQAVWYFVNRYVLEQMNGSMVVEWSVVTDASQIEDAWPRKSEPSSDPAP